ncbi:glycerate kinase-like [Montipora foliosa]|uniref:glycerate kinase-like n=1 Tax=Montipora foliosa TaxID=591990 RepID=UPI0035F10F0A
MSFLCLTRAINLQGSSRCSLWRSRWLSHLSFNKDLQLKLKSDAQIIFKAALTAVSPQEMVKNNLSFHRNILSLEDREYAVNKNVSVVAFGKAVLGMAKAVEDILRDNITRGVASVPVGLPDAIKASGNKKLIEKSILRDDSPITVLEGALNNLPDDKAYYAAGRIKQIAEDAGDGDILVVLISGGGSALLPFPVPGITLDEKLRTIKALASCGATIHELNVVRKNLSDLKGGKLAMAAFPAKVVSLILSDVIGDPLDIIASGPTVPDPSTPGDCLDVIKKLNAKKKIPDAVIKYLMQAEQNGGCTELDVFSHVQNVIVGSNRFAVEAALKRAKELDYAPIVLSTTLSGEARDVGCMFSDLAQLAWNGNVPQISPVSEALFTDDIVNCVMSARNSNKPVCIIAAGETTVTLKGKGTGGRNQEMALALAIAVEKKFKDFGSKSDNKSKGGLVLLSAGTDGQDGPTPAAGAMADLHQVTEALNDGLDPEGFLQNNDSYSFYSKFKNGRDHLVTGLTGTNVMDIQILLVSPPVDDIHQI